MSHLRFERVWSGRLADVSVELDAGVHVIIGAEADGTGELVELCAGVRAPRRGAVEVDGFAPSRSPACRRTIASLLPNEQGGESRSSLESWLAELGARLGFAPQAPLERARLPPWRPLASLSGGERRRLACHVALAQESPRLVAMHEPLPAVSPDDRPHVLARLAELGRDRVVLVTTASHADARELGGTTFRLDRGLLALAPGGAWPAAAAPGGDVWLEVEADAPRALVSALAQHPEVRELAYDEERTGRVLVRGAELEPLASAVARAAVGAHVEIRLLRARPDDLETARAAATGLAHAAYRAAQAHAARRAPGGSPATPNAPVEAPPRADPSQSERSP